MHEVDIHGSLSQFVGEKCRHKNIPQTPLRIPARQTAPGAMNSQKWIKALYRKTSVHRLLRYRWLHMLWNNGTETVPPEPFGDERSGKYFEICVPYTVEAQSKNTFEVEQLAVA